HGHSFAPEHADVAGLRARVEREIDRPAEGVDGDGRTERRLDDREVHLREDVVALAHEAVVLADAHLHVGIAGPAAEHAGVPLARDPDPLAVVDSRGHLDLERLLLERAPVAVARLARLLDAPAAAVAVRAGRLADELAENAPGDLLHDAV